MIYVCSDIHGSYDLFLELLKQLQLQDDDTLYVLGDAIDKGPNSVNVLLEIVNNPHIEFLLGNHEYMMLPAIRQWINEGRPDELSYQMLYTHDLWLRYNQGFRTMQEFMQISGEDQDKILKLLQNACIGKRIKVNNKTFYLTHTCFAQDRLQQDAVYISDVSERELWDIVWCSPYRSSFDTNVPLQVYTEHPDITFVFGHVPYHKANPECTIYYNQNTILLDGGLSARGFGKLPYSALACLRLDDMQEFYIPLPEDDDFSCV